MAQLALHLKIQVDTREQHQSCMRDMRVMHTRWLLFVVEKTIRSLNVRA